MIFLSQNNVLGELVVQEVFLYYDGPRLFVAENAVEQKYLVNCILSEDASDTWLVSAISDKRLLALRNGTLDLRDAFTKPELGYVFDVTVDKGGLLLRHSMKKPEQLQTDDLPEAGVFLKSKLDDREDLNVPHSQQRPVVPALKLSSDLTFITNEPDNLLRDRFGKLLKDDTRFFDCLVGYFFISGFYKLYPVLENVERVRILVGLKTDRTAYNLIQRAKNNKS